jgi:tetratricopeptide (TPR) repeat protein
VGAVLAARIDRLSEREKSLLQSAAVIGREFSQPVLARAAELPEGELESALRALIAAEFVYEQELYPDAVYAFKHPLTQEVAYRSQLGERRGSAAGALPRQAGRARRAARPALGGRRGSPRRGAVERTRRHLVGAQRHLRGGPALAQGQRAGPSAARLGRGDRAGARRCVWRLGYGWRLGISEQEASAHYEAGRELAERSGDRASLLLITTMYASVRGMAGHVKEYGELGEEVDRLSSEIGDPGLRMASLAVPIVSGWDQGRLGDALALTDEAITAIERSIELGREARTGLEQESLRIAGLSEALLSAGDHQRALDAARESVKLARERGNEVVLAISCRVLAEALLAGDGPDRIAMATEALDQAAAAVEATGARAELPFIERARARLVPVS